VTTLLAARNLQKVYGDVIALAGIDFEVNEGVTGLLGANGAGKSTVIKLFLGLIQPTSGTAEVLGVDAASTVEIRSQIGYMPEHDCLPGNVSATEFLTHMAELSGLPPNQARSRAADTLRHVGLFEERYRAMGGYSTGMKQRVKLAQTLVHDPALVLLDEPTAGLDPGGREEMLTLIRRTGQEFGISLMLSSHLMGDIERTCDSIVVLDEGKVVEVGPVTSFTEETEAIAVEVDENREELIAALKERGVEPLVDGNSIVIEGVIGDQYDLIRDALVAANAPLRRMAPRRHELTEIFERDVE
jgi:ABC-2 type transport system ATP-binding protein